MWGPNLNCTTIGKIAKRRYRQKASNNELLVMAVWKRSYAATSRNQPVIKIDGALMLNAYLIGLGNKHFRHLATKITKTFELFGLRNPLRPSAHLGKSAKGSAPHWLAVIDTAASKGPSMTIHSMARGMWTVQPFTALNASRSYALGWVGACEHQARPWTNLKPHQAVLHVRHGKHNKRT